MFKRILDPFAMSAFQRDITKHFQNRVPDGHTQPIDDIKRQFGVWPYLFIQTRCEVLVEAGVLTSHHIPSPYAGVAKKRAYGLAE